MNEEIKSIFTNETIRLVFCIFQSVLKQEFRIIHIFTKHQQMTDFIIENKQFFFHPILLRKFSYQMQERTQVIDT